MSDAQTADDIFDAARQLGEIIAAQRAKDQQAKKDARNARRRAHYRANPPARKPKTPTAVVVVDDVDFEPGCRCHLVQHPPCTWCENGGAADD